jgi:hypothetical protein
LARHPNGEGLQEGGMTVIISEDGGTVVVPIGGLRDQPIVDGTNFPLASIFPGGVTTGGSRISVPQ